MEHILRVKDVAEILGCSCDTARARMAEMPGVINVGSRHRRQLMVPEGGLEDWLRNHRVEKRQEIQQAIRIPRCKNGKLARMDRRTGKLVAV